MWIVAIGWMYVVTLMAATEPSVVGGMMTFLGYGVLPLSLVLYLGGVRLRRRPPPAPRSEPAAAPDEADPPGH
ncbi:hypothetical protein [Massilia phyllosphaerae]|uniref:hypothetical protein n=1 Tax=Massilia phyllosphaerae TaxID=3106034 RepID=UPI002B1CB02E|nr:hypothetical protein [Massilia sp. SGZ-792]